MLATTRSGEDAPMHHSFKVYRGRVVQPHPRTASACGKKEKKALNVLSSGLRGIFFVERSEGNSCDLPARADGSFEGATEAAGSRKLAIACGGMGWAV